MALKLFTEFIDFQSLEILTEETKVNGKSVKIKGPFLQAEVKNRNGRIYTKELYSREIDRFNKEKIKTNKAMGELDHPLTPAINLDRVSHRIDSLVMDGNNGMGIATILDTPMGKIAKTLVTEGIVLGVSSRGIGSVAKTGKVNDDYRMVTIDIVSDPSAPGAFVEGVLENKEYIIEGNKIMEVAIDNLQSQMDKKGSKEAYNAMLEFLDTVKKKI